MRGGRQRVGIGSGRKRWEAEGRLGGNRKMWEAVVGRHRQRY